MCEGVLIGQQMILELEARGEEVELFTIFDTWVLENTQIRPLWAINYYRERLQGLWSSSMREQLAILWKTVRRWFSQSPPANGSGWKETYWPSEGFAAPRFKAPVLLFKRPRQPFYYIRDPQMGWGARSTGGVEICEINCGHTEVLREPYVRIIGQILATRLQGAKDREGERDSALPADKAINQWVRVSSLDDVGKAVKGR
jgi:thioesterase domain-containing protein